MDTHLSGLVLDFLPSAIAPFNFNASNTGMFYLAIGAVLVSAAAGAPTVPATMTAAKRGLFGCQTPFKCIHIVNEATPTELSEGQVR